jgi:predicted dehydrogenase
MADRRPEGLAVVGADHRGQELIRTILRGDEADLRWVCDLDIDGAARAVGHHSSVRTTDSLAEVLHDPRVTAVVVATPARTRAAVALACLEANKHVLVETPFASSAAEGRRLVDAASRRGLILMCDHWPCFTPAVRNVRRLVERGELGEIQYVDALHVDMSPGRSGAGVFWDLAPDLLSILDFVLPANARPTGVAALAADPVDAGHPCVGHLTLPLSNGTVAQIHLNRLGPVEGRTMLVGGSRMVVSEDLDPESEAPGGAVDEFLSAVREWRPAVTSGAAGLWVLEILEAAERSLDLGGVVVPLTRIDRGAVEAA